LETPPKPIIREQFLQEQTPTWLIIASLLSTHQCHKLKMCIKLFTPRNKLNLKPITSLPMKKFRTIYKVQIIDSREDEERTCSEEMGGGDDE